jgi:hypothetical protein
VSLGSILLLWARLALVAMAVAAARGLAVRQIGASHVLLVAAFFGGFQALMPLFAGRRFGAALGRSLDAARGMVLISGREDAARAPQLNSGARRECALPTESRTSRTNFG